MTVVEVVAALVVTASFIDLGFGLLVALLSDLARAMRRAVKRWTI